MDVTRVVFKNSVATAALNHFSSIVHSFDQQWIDFAHIRLWEIGRGASTSEMRVEPTLKRFSKRPLPGVTK